VSFGGGEPFLRKDLAQLAGSFASRGLKHLAIPTNGLVEERMQPFVEDVLSRHPELFLSIAVSFDGPPAIHDAIRQVPGGPLLPAPPRPDQWRFDPRNQFQTIEPLCVMLKVLAAAQPPSTIGSR
ncbi:MAG: hypothetical protein ACKOEC_15655, partial [Acidimicrobiia bacterium]